MQILEQKVNFQECLYMKKGDALAPANSARACSDCLSPITSWPEPKCLPVEKLAWVGGWPLHWGRGDAATISDQNKLRHYAQKGLSDVLLSSKGENKAFPPPYLHAMLWRCLSYLQRTTNTPTLNGGDREGCGFFCSLKLPYLSTMSQQFCCWLFAGHPSSWV